MQLKLKMVEKFVEQQFLLNVPKQNHGIKDLKYHHVISITAVQNATATDAVTAHHHEVLEEVDHVTDLHVIDDTDPEQDLAQFQGQEENTRDHPEEIDRDHDPDQDLGR